MRQHIIHSDIVLCTVVMKMSKKSKTDPSGNLSSLLASELPRVAVVREEGSNGDREMSASLHMAGFEVCHEPNRTYWMCVPVHVTSVGLCVGLGRDHAGPGLRFAHSGALQSRGVCRRIQLCRCTGISERQMSEHTHCEFPLRYSPSFLNEFLTHVKVGLPLLLITPRPRLSLIASDGGATR